MSAVHCCRMSRMVAGVVLLLLAYQSASLQAQERPAPSVPAMERVRLSEDGTEFILAESGTKFVPWGFNFVGEFGQIVEEYWANDWPSVEEDFRRMRDLGANVAAKTGTIRGVSALAGYVRAESGKILAFAFLVNDPHMPLAKSRKLQDDVCRALRKGL